MTKFVWGQEDRPREVVTEVRLVPGEPHRGGFILQMRPVSGDWAGWLNILSIDSAGVLHLSKFGPTDAANRGLTRNVNVIAQSDPH